MIFDALPNADAYFTGFTGDWWRDTLVYLRAATPSLPDGVHPVRGDVIVARVHTGQRARPATRSSNLTGPSWTCTSCWKGGKRSPSGRLINSVSASSNDKQDGTFYDLPSGRERGCAARLTASPFSFLRTPT